jgi:hypothetical protein
MNIILANRNSELEKRPYASNLGFHELKVGEYDIYIWLHQTAYLVLE